MKKLEYNLLLKEFESFFNSGTLEGEDSPEDGLESRYQFEEADDVYYILKKRHGFEDVNCSIDLEHKQFGLRSDDDFWAVAYLPWRFRFLRIEDLAPIIWPGEKLTLIPTSPSHAYNVYYNVRPAERYVELYKEAGSVTAFKRMMADGEISDRKFALKLFRYKLECRKSFMDLLPASDPLRKIIQKVKPKAHRRFQRKENLREEKWWKEHPIDGSGMSSLDCLDELFPPDS